VFLWLRGVCYPLGRGEWKKERSSADRVEGGGSKRSLGWHFVGSSFMLLFTRSCLSY
jgi:hypothetical protein